MEPAHAVVGEPVATWKGFGSPPLRQQRTPRTELDGAPLPHWTSRFNHVGPRRPLPACVCRARASAKFGVPVTYQGSRFRREQSGGDRAETEANQTLNNAELFNQSTVNVVFRLVSARWIKTFPPVCVHRRCSNDSPAGTQNASAAAGPPDRLGSMSSLPSSNSECVCRHGYRPVSPS